MYGSDQFGGRPETKIDLLFPSCNCTLTQVLAAVEKMTALQVTGIFFKAWFCESICIRSWVGRGVCYKKAISNMIDAWYTRIGKTR